MFTRQANITVTTSYFARYMITTLVAMHNSGTFLFAAIAIETIIARFRAIITGPAGRAYAMTGVGITGGIIFTSANLITILTIKTGITTGFAMNAFNVLFFEITKINNKPKTGIRNERTARHNKKRLKKEEKHN